MAGVKRRVRVADQGYIALPAEFVRKHRLKAGDEVDVEETDQGVLITQAVGGEPMRTDQQPQFVYTPPTAAELAQRKTAVNRILALRAKTPSIAPLTTADLVHMSRDDNFWYGEEEPTANGTSA